jgi:hypothetical protein
METTESYNLKKLTRFDWFGITSGVIGLTADAITIISLKPQATSITIWIVSFLGIIYSTLIASFYARRIFSSKHKSQTGSLSSKQTWIINDGASALSAAVGVPLLVAFFFVVTLAVVDMSPTATIADKVLTVPAITLFCNLGFSIMIWWMINGAAKLMYAAFDPDFDVD